MSFHPRERGIRIAVYPMNTSRLAFDTPPYRTSGAVYGTLLNSKAALKALGDSVDASPYKGAPKAPVLYLKPTNTQCGESEPLLVPVDTDAMEVGASLGIVIGRTACNVPVDSALDYVAGFTVVADLSVPHAKFYRPSLRFKVVDATCAVGPGVVPTTSVKNPDELKVTVVVNGVVAQAASTSGMSRGVSKLVADVSEFMTLSPGDILMLGVAANAPLVRAGQVLSIEIESVGTLRKKVEGAKA